jgi:hypothetical protein
MNTIEGINIWLVRDGLRDIGGSIVLMLLCGLAAWVGYLIWTEFPLYLCFWGGSTVLLCLWFWWDTYKHQKG